jgi:hypothetical protein
MRLRSAMQKSLTSAQADSVLSSREFTRQAPEGREFTRQAPEGREFTRQAPNGLSFTRPAATDN